MQLAVSLWQLVQQDRIVRWGTYATAALCWFALAWAELRLLIALPIIMAGVWWLRRQRERHGWLAEPEDDLDLL
jgi:4-hydroxybenzoate polyprenyltransferase